MNEVVEIRFLGSPSNWLAERSMNYSKIYRLSGFSVQPLGGVSLRLIIACMERTLKALVPKTKRLFWVALAVVLVCSPKGHAQGTIKSDTKTVQIEVRGVSDADRATITGVYSVSSSGEIDLPRIGKVKIPGWGYAVLSLAIQKAYRDSGGLPNVEVDAWFWDGCCLGASSCIDVSGDVWVSRLSIPIRFGSMKLSEALKVTRPKDSANLAELEILRDGKPMRIDATKKEGLDTELKNHDVILVPTKERAPHPSGQSM